MANSLLTGMTRLSWLKSSESHVIENRIAKASPRRSWCWKCIWAVIQNHCQQTGSMEREKLEMWSGRRWLCTCAKHWLPFCCFEQKPWLWFQVRSEIV